MRRAQELAAKKAWCGSPYVVARVVRRRLSMQAIVDIWLTTHGGGGVLHRDALPTAGADDRFPARGTSGLWSDYFDVLPNEDGAAIAALKAA